MINYTENDYAEVKLMTQILERVDKGNLQDWNKMSDEMYLRQPFVLSVILGYVHDLQPDVAEEVIKLYMLMWAYFDSQGAIPTVPVTEAVYNVFFDHNIKYLQLFDTTQGDEQRMALVENDTRKIKSKALWSVLFHRSRDDAKLCDLAPQIKVVLKIGLRSFIDSFEAE